MISYILRKPLSIVIAAFDRKEWLRLQSIAFLDLIDYIYIYIFFNVSLKYFIN